MEKLTKSYVSYLFWGREWEEKEIQERDPELVSSIVNLDDITSFYFYDQSFINDGEDIYVGKRKNISKRVYVGERLSLEEAIMYAEGKTKQYLERLLQSNNKGVVAICRTSKGIFEMYEGDITFDEYMVSKNNSKKI